MPEHPRSPNTKDWPLGAAEAVAAAVVAMLVSVAAEAEAGAAAVAAAAVWAADAEASSLEAVSAALPAEGAAIHPAGYGHQLGAGSTSAGVSPRLRQRYLMSRRGKQNG
jgi:hypothetical protein